MRSNADASSAIGVEAGHYSIESSLDDQEIGAARRWLLLICAFVMWVDAFDSFVVGKIAPLLQARIPRKARGDDASVPHPADRPGCGAFAATSLPPTSPDFKEQGI